MLLTLDLQEAVRLSSKSGTVSGLEILESSGHLAALDELSQKMLQKVGSCKAALIPGTVAVDWVDIASGGSRKFNIRNFGSPFLTANSRQVSRSPVN
jgi:hypothetical protein